VCHSPKIFTSLSHQERRAPKKPRNLIYKGDTKKETKFVVEKDQEEEKKKKKEKKRKINSFLNNTLYHLARAFSLSLSLASSSSSFEEERREKGGGKGV